MDKKTLVTATIYDHIVGIFKVEEGEIPDMKLEEIDADFFGCAVTALNLFYGKITNEKVDNVDFIGILNKIVVQRLLEDNAKLK